ncbi:LysR family transcriptional regulator [Pseudothauera lacus]|nr:LysR family transcriptional regulator [Pseudothauera lacus]
MSRTLNYKHLRYFWMVARCGSIARASERLHLTPHAVSGQLTQFEHSLGVALFQRQGRQRALTEAGRSLLDYADRIFALGDEALAALDDAGLHLRPRITIGIADSLPKSIAAGLLRTMLRMDPPVRLTCTEGRLPQLVGELGMHRVAAVLADRPLPPGISVRAYSHLLGRSPLTVFAAPALLERQPRAFPALLDGAPFLMPGEDVAFRPALQQWLSTRGIEPQVVAEFDDLALLKAFGSSGAGFFVAPTKIAADIERQYGVCRVGELETVLAEVYLLTTERLLKHPAMQEIRRTATMLLKADGAA